MVLSSKQGYASDHALVQSSSPEMPKSGHSLKCPRCGSTNTKFCYFNNYNKTQPRHFCKSCKRHWTKGGALRNVPVGGGRKNKRPKITNTSSQGGPENCRTDPPLSNSNGDQRATPNILYHALIRSSSSNMLHNTQAITQDINTTGLHDSVPSFPLNRNTEFSLSFFNTESGTNITSLNSNYPISHTSLKSYGCYSTNLDYSTEESTIPTVNISSTTGPSTNSTATYLPNYWDWNDIDNVLTSSDHLNLSWDDNGLGFKPSNQS